MLVQGGAHGEAAHKSALAVLARHNGEVLCTEFSSSGRSFATGSSDRTVRVSATTGDDLRELLLLTGHARAVRRVRWMRDNLRLVSASSDGTLAVWDLVEGERALSLKNNKSSVNDCAVYNENAVVSASDDGRACFWDLRVRGRAVLHFEEKYPLLCVAADAENHRLAAAGIDGVIRVYDVRRAATAPACRPTDLTVRIGAGEGQAAASDGEPEGCAADAVQPEPHPAPLLLSPPESHPGTLPLFTLHGHSNTITSLDFSPKQALLASTGADQTVRLWNARPFVPAEEAHRRVALGRGPTHNFEQTLHRIRFSPDGCSVGVGSADRSAYILSAEGESMDLLLRLGNHTGAVTEVAFHPTERVLVTAATDRTAMLRRLDTLVY